jgi:hypothetical protein
MDAASEPQKCPDLPTSPTAYPLAARTAARPLSTSSSATAADAPHHSWSRP